jgi:hypothetical protein
VPAATTLALRDRIHGALHSGELTDGTPLDDMVYLWKLTKKNGIVCTVTLTISAPDPNVPRNKAAHIAATNPKKVAAQVEDAILTGVPEITRVVVVNSKGAIVSEASRK